jgi:trigger factor
MQVTETLSQGLKREFKVVVPATDLEERLTSELDVLKDRVRINGFRPGKVPVAATCAGLRPLGHGRVVQNAVNEKPTQDRRPSKRPQARQRAADQFPRTRTRSSRPDRRQGDLSYTVASRFCRRSSSPTSSASR